LEWDAIRHGHVVVEVIGALGEGPTKGAPWLVGARELAVFSGLPVQIDDYFRRGRQTHELAAADDAVRRHT
jgi:hypothetical protein